MKLKFHFTSIMLVILAFLIPIVAIAEEKTDAAPAQASAPAPASSAPADATANAPAAIPAVPPAPEAAPAPSNASPEVKPALNTGEKENAKPDRSSNTDKKEDTKTELSSIDMLKYGVGCIIVLVIICKMCSSSSRKKDSSPPQQQETPPNDVPVNKRAALKLGMTFDELVAIYGKPTEVKRNISKNKSTITCCYKPKTTRQGNVTYGLEVTFENDRVVKFVD